MCGQGGIPESDSSIIGRPSGAGLTSLCVLQCALFSAAKNNDLHNTLDHQIGIGLSPCAVVVGSLPRRQRSEEALATAGPKPASEIPGIKMVRLQNLVQCLLLVPVHHGHSNKFSLY